MSPGQDPFGLGGGAPPPAAGHVDVVWNRGYDAGAMLRELVVSRTGADPGPLHHLCPVCGALTHGRPSYDAPVEVSIARAGDLVVVALSLDGPVGVDAAPTGPGARAWARTEALAKAHGTGIVAAHDPTDPGVWIRDVALPDGIVGAVAGLGPAVSDPPEVRAAPRRTTRR